MAVLHFTLFSLIFSFLTSLAGDLYDLSPRFVEGLTWSVEDHVETTVVSDLFRGRRQSQVLSFRKYYRVDKIHQDGRVDQTMSLEVLEREGGGPFAGLDWSRLNGVPIAMTLDREGSILEIKDPQGLDDQSRPLFNFLKQILITNQQVLFLPGKPVSLDETWNKTEAIAFDLPYYGSVDEIFEISGSLQAVKTVAERECFEIQFLGAHSGSVGSNSPGKIEGVMKGTMLWDAERGHCLRFESESDIKMVVVTDEGDVLMEIKSKGVSQIVQGAAVR